MKKRRLSLVWGLFAALIAGAPSMAADTTTYSYDALGRLVKVEVAGGPAAGVQTNMQFDPAGNRTTYAVSGGPASVAFAVNSVTATEGAALVFTVTKTGTAAGTLTVNYATSNGTAGGSDYTGTSGTLTFLAGETSKTISVPTTDDALVESSETVILTLSAASGGATISGPTGTGTITDNDTPPSFAISNAAAVTEGGTLVFTVTKTGAAGASYTVNYASASGTATSGSDFNAVSGTLTFLAGETSKTISVSTTDDAAVESAETVLVNLSSPSGGATITTSQASGTINDNDLPPPSFAIANAGAVAEGGTLAFTVTKTGATNTAFSVNYASASGTATSGTDFTPASGTLTFLAGETSKTINVATIDDSAVEPDETVLVNLSSPTGGATITTSQGSGTINNNDVSNLPPVANPDTTSFICSGYKTVNLVANDTDPENNTPLTLVSITDLSGMGYAAVTSSTSATIGEPQAGTYTFTYVVADSLGATSTGQLTATVTGKEGICIQF